MKKANRITCRTAVYILRENLAPSLAQTLTPYQYFNAARVVKVDHDRVCVAWADNNKLWFDAEAVQLASIHDQLALEAV